MLPDSSVSDKEVLVMNSEIFFRHKKQISQFGKFFGVGIVATTAHYVSMVFAIEFLHVAVISASSVGYIVGAIFSYVINYKFTFGSNRSHADASIRFVFGTLLGFMLNAAIVGIGINLLDANYLITQVTATGIVFFINFTISKFWTFKRI